MIEIIYGRKGSGKTKRIIDMANLAVKEHDGDLVFIDDDNRYMFDLRHEIRFINATEYMLSNPDMFLGFLAGIVATNYDMSLLFIDGFLRIVQAEINELGGFFARLEAMTQKNNLTVVISCSGDPDTAPDFLRPYII